MDACREILYLPVKELAPKLVLPRNEQDRQNPALWRLHIATAAWDTTTTFELSGFLSDVEGECEILFVLPTCMYLSLRRRSNSTAAVTCTSVAFSLRLLCPLLGPTQEQVTQEREGTHPWLAGGRRKCICGLVLTVYGETFVMLRSTLLNRMRRHIRVTLEILSSLQYPAFAHSKLFPSVLHLPYNRCPRLFLDERRQKCATVGGYRTHGGR